MSLKKYVNAVQKLLKMEFTDDEIKRFVEDERPLCLIARPKKETKKRKRKFNNYIRRMRYGYKKAGMKVKIKRTVHGIFVTVIHSFSGKEIN